MSHAARARQDSRASDPRTIHVDPSQFRGAQLRFEGRVAEAIRIVIHERGMDISFPGEAADQPDPAKRSRGGRRDRAADDPRLPAIGKTVEGKYKGEIFRAKILDGGKVKMNGVVYGSLSAAAKAARGGKPTSGYVFFGIKG